MPASKTEGPAFLVLGAAKSGTTALYTQLGQHPDVCLPSVKETNFFALENHQLDFRGPGDHEALTKSDAVSTVTRWDDYLQKFSDCPDSSVHGEICPLYLYSSEAPKRIHRYVPEALLIAILRHPADRAYSAYRMMLTAGRETETNFRRALALESSRIQKGWESAWHYQAMGRYSEQLQRYMALFPRQQLRIYLYDDFARHPQVILDDLCDFIGIDRFSPDLSARPGMTGIPRSQWLQRTLTRPNPLRSTLRRVVPVSWRRGLGSTVAKWNRRIPVFDPEIRQWLTESLRKEILDLQRLIGRDLSHWLGEESTSP